MTEGFFPGAQHLQNVHPLVVHFPIAFLVGAALLYTLAWIARRETWAHMALWLLTMGTLGAAVAVGTGPYAEPGIMVARTVRAQLLDVHKRFMLATFALAVVLTLWAGAQRPFPEKGRAVFILLVLVLLAALAKGADYGGRMVYDYNAGGNACPQPIEFSR